jgi:hypothetical protein
MPILHLQARSVLAGERSQPWEENDGNHESHLGAVQKAESILSGRIRLEVQNIQDSIREGEEVWTINLIF